MAGGLKRFLQSAETNSEPVRFFYCLPIEPMASSVWVSHRSWEEPQKNKENDGR
jgi:hypothetical protein